MKDIKVLEVIQSEKDRLLIESQKTVKHDEKKEKKWTEKWTERHKVAPKLTV